MLYGKIKILAPRSIASLPDGLHADGGNLFLRVRDDSRAWVFRYKKEGKQTWLGLGSPNFRSLSEARKEKTPYMGLWKNNLSSMGLNEFASNNFAMNF